MNEPEPSPEIPPDLLADLDYAIRLVMSGSRDPAFEARVRARSERIRDEVSRERGLLNVAVDLIRETRDEE